jgi:hypothetical protein
MTENKRQEQAHQGMDWTQVQETIRMLHLAVGQIEISMSDGDDSVDVLAQNFTETVDCVNAIVAAAGRLGLPAENDSALGGEIRGHCDTALDRVQTAIVAFQFYDKLSQRLSHVSHSLQLLAELVGDGRRVGDAREWQALQQEIRSRYTVEGEAEMFDAVLAGESVAAVLKRLQQAAAAAPAAEIEFF